MQDFPIECLFQICGKMLSQTYLYLLLITIINVIDIVFSASSCPDVKTIENFEPQRFTGKWYEIEKYPNVWEAGQKCITANYQLNPNGTITVLNKINYPISIKGIATPNASDPAKLTVEFSRFGRGNLWILETDYQNYALTYSCTTLPLIPISIENAWILSRTPKLEPQIVDLLKSRLSAVNSPTFMFYATDQTNCASNSQAATPK